MKDNKKAVESILDQLLVFLNINKEKNIVTADFKDESAIGAFSWVKPEQDTKDLLKQLQAYQRISKLLPKQEDELVISLLKDGLNSALSIANIPKDKFMASYGPLFEKAALSVSAFYDNASTVKANVLLEYMRIKQQAEPHISQTNLNSKI